MVTYNEPLSAHCTLRIGGTCDRYYTPDSVEELKHILANEPSYYVLSGGSNLLINDKKKFSCVIDMRKVNDDFTDLGNGKVFIGASLRIQKVITLLQDLDLGGFEFLYSLPALFGGVIYMNAGRGSDKKCISQYVYSVTYMDENGAIHDIPKNDCAFSYRSSIFQKQKWIILGATLECEIIPAGESRKLVQERIDFCKGRQDMRFQNAGSTFSICNMKIMKVIQFFAKYQSKEKRVGFSDRTLNWINNMNNGSYDDVIKEIKKVTLLHKLLGRKIKVEYRIWE